MRDLDSQSKTEENAMSDTRVETLRQALKFEEDGKAYYESARDKTNNQMGKKLFEFLIKAEDSHIEKIKKLFQRLEQTGKWPEMIPTRGHGDAASNIFSEALKSVGEKVKGTTDDLQALKLALAMESKGKKFYEARAEATEEPFEKKFYFLLAHEEGEHFVSILDTLQYLEDPGSYFHQLELTKGYTAL